MLRGSVSSPWNLPYKMNCGTVRTSSCRRSSPLRQHAISESKPQATSRFAALKDGLEGDLVENAISHRAIQTALTDEINV